MSESTNQTGTLMRFAADIVLRNGMTLRLRPVFASDEDRILEFLEGLSAETLVLRFGAPRKASPSMAREMAFGDPETTFGFVAESGGRIVGIAHYYRNNATPTRAEVAFMVADGMRGIGIGMRLLERLGDVAREVGIRLFEAEVLPTNLAMARVFVDSGFQVVESEHGRHFEMAIEPTESFEDRAAARALSAATASMKALFEPRSIAVVGAGRHRRHLGAELFHNLLEGGFRGTLHPVNPAATEVAGIAAVASVGEIEQDVDLAIIAVPATEVDKVVDDCIAKGVRAIVVMSGGFGEAGDEGRDRETTLVEKIRSAGIRLVGPNSMGLLNTDPNVCMHGTFSPVFPPPGTVAMSTQSGALGLATLGYARRLNIGFSTFISVGNKADVSGNDLVQYWAADPKTDVILLYLESFGNPNNFGRIARRVARSKPIVAVKSGRSLSGARAAQSHSGASTAVDAIVGDLFRQAGVIRTDTLEEMFDVATLLANQPLPAGRRIAIVTNAGGPAIMAADACEVQGLELASLDPATVDALHGILAGDAVVENPIDVKQWADAEQYRKTIGALVDDPGVDAILVIHIPVFSEDLADVVRGIGEGTAAATSKPIVGAIMSASGTPEGLAPLPCFPFPERAVAALARVARYAEWRRKPVGRLVKRDIVDVGSANEIIRGSIDAGRSWLLPQDARALLRATGIESVDVTILTDADSAVTIAGRIGYPVVLKAVVTSKAHDFDTAASREAIANDAGLRLAWDDLARRFGDALAGIAIQKMVPDAIDVTLGVTEQPTFGRLIYFGSSSRMCVATGDVAYRFHPLTDVDATDMIREVRMPPSPWDDIDLGRALGHVEEALHRLSSLLDGCPEIREMELASVRLTSDSLSALEVHVRVGEPKVDARARRVLY